MYSRCSNCSSSDAIVEVTPIGMHLDDDDGDDAVLVEAHESYILDPKNNLNPETKLGDSTYSCIPLLGHFLLTVKL